MYYLRYVFEEKDFGKYFTRTIMHEEQVVKRYSFCLSIPLGVETGLVRRKRGWGSVLCKYFKLNNL